MDGSPEARLFWLVTVLAGIPALVFLIVGIRQFRKRAMLRAMPTTPIAGVFVGEVEIKGKAMTESPVVGYLSGHPCLRYEWSVAEHWTRTRMVTVRDSKGRTHTRMERYSGTDTVASGGEIALHEVEDATGRVLLQPEGASIEQAVIFESTVGEGDPLYYGKGPDGAVSGSDGRRTFSESGIVVGAPLYVVGFAREREDAVAVEIAAGGRKGSATEGANPRMFLISTRDESAITRGHAIAGWVCFCLGALATLGFLALECPPVDVPAFPIAFTLALSAYLGLFGLAWLWSTYNELVDLRNRVVRSSSNIDVQLKRRCDLIAGLVECASAMRDHEATIHKEIAILRAQGELRDRGMASGRAEPVGAIVRALAEGYPDLRAGEVFLRLQVVLTDSEQRIALARDEFNGVAQGYNVRIAQFPVNLLAGLMRVYRANFFRAEAFERRVPVIAPQR